MSDTIQINGHRAAILYAALEQATEVTRAQLKLKSAAPYRAAIGIQIADYEAEKALLAEAFPELKDSG